MKTIEQAHTCTTCGKQHYVPSLARDCENRHKDTTPWNK